MITGDSIIKDPGTYCASLYNFDSDSLFTAIELTVAKQPNTQKLIVGLMKQTKYLIANRQIRPKITYYTCADRNLVMLPNIGDNLSLSTIVSWVRSNLSENSSEPNLN